MSVLVQQRQQLQPDGGAATDTAGARARSGASGDPGTGTGGDGKAAAAEEEELVFLYRLVPGHAAPSFGVYCAQLAGVLPAVLARARHVIAAEVGCCALMLLLLDGGLGVFLL